MGKILVGLLTAFCMFTASPAIADEEESPLYLELQLTKGWGGGEGVVSKKTQGYGEYNLHPERGISLWTIVYLDRDTTEGHLGVAKKLNENVQVGIGLGNARYDSINHLVKTGWAFYEKDGIEGVLSVTHYSRDREAPWFVKAYGKLGLTERFSAGAYYETGFGAGPMLTYKFTDHLSLELVWSVGWRDSGELGGMARLVASH